MMQYIAFTIYRDTKRSSLIKAIFPPRPLEKEYKEGYCLSVPEEVMSGLWVYTAEKDRYTFGLHLKVVNLG